MFREPAYKRRRGNGSRGGAPYGNRNWNNNQGQQSTHKHWDEPSASTGGLQNEVAAPAPAKKDKPKRYQIDHSLTQDELWDDSALIAAWDSAVEEYQSLHGPEKKWKEEPVHKSALWYAQPAKPQDEEEDEDNTEGEEGELGADEEGASTEQEVEPDSIPIDFHTFVPSHDPTLGAGTATQAAGTMAIPDVSTLTKDEIFEKAVSASYWAGYWTAMYHASGATSSAQNEVDEEEVEADEMVHVVDAGESSQ